MSKEDTAMSKFTSTNVSYYLMVGLLQDAMPYSMSRCLERDMLALVSEEPPVRYSTKDDVHHLAALVIRCFEKAGIDVTSALGEESDYNTSVDKAQVIKDLFVLHAEVKDFMGMTWNGEKAQQNALDELMGKTLAAAAHSRTLLRSDIAKRVFINV
jgi:hypothetical protein